MGGPCFRLDHPKLVIFMLVFLQHRTPGGKKQLASQWAIMDEYRKQGLNIDTSDSLASNTRLFFTSPTAPCQVFRPGQSHPSGFRTWVRILGKGRTKSKTTEKKKEGGLARIMENHEEGECKNKALLTLLRMFLSNMCLGENPNKMRK